MGGGGTIFRFYGDTQLLRGGHRTHGGPPSPPTRENPDFTLTDALVTIQTINLSVPGSELKKEMNGRGRHLEQKILFLTINKVQPTLFL